MKLRAIHAEDKALRRKHILAAAERLVVPGSYDLVSVDKIAALAGLAKGTVYLYFKTKEEIYLAVLAKSFEDWIETLLASLSDSQAAATELIGGYCDYCVAHPRTLFLACLAPSILERNITEEQAYAFKKNLADAIMAIGEKLNALYPGLSEARARQMFLHTFVLTTGLWQHAHPAPVVQRVYQRPEMAVIGLDFESELKQALTALWSGYGVMGDRAA